MISRTFMAFSNFHVGRGTQAPISEWSLTFQDSWHLLSILRDQERLQAMTHCFTLFQLAFSLPIAISTSLEGSVIKMKSASPVPVDTTVTLKAKLDNICYNFWSIFKNNGFLILLVMSSKCC